MSAYMHRVVVHWDELDAMGILHNTRYAVHVERAVVAYFRTFGPAWQDDVRQNSDQFHAVREFRIEFMAPVRGVGELIVEITATRVGTSACTHAFRVLNADGTFCHASGSRTVIKLDPESLRPVAWSDRFRVAHLSIMSVPAAPGKASAPTRRSA